MDKTNTEMTRKEIRGHFSDFRYLTSTDKPYIFKEFVLYEEVIKLLKEIGVYNDNTTEK